MASWSPAEWEPSSDTGLPRADRRHGPYHHYLPDFLSQRPLFVPSDVAVRAATAERAVRDLGAAPGTGSVEGVSRFLLRSEAIASSLIEGIAPSPQQVALAELAQDEQIRGFSDQARRFSDQARGFSDQARLVANNITVLRHASLELASTDAVRIADIETLHHTLLPEEQHRGFRTVQNWIGGSNWHPIDADFVPPPHELVAPLMGDLIDYLNGSVHAPLIQAALVHAQFETVHPFTDGNGRVGRALIHTVLTRRGLTTGAVLPVSLVLATMRDTYVAGLSAYRYDSDMNDVTAREGVAGWLDVFIEATRIAAGQAHQFAEDIAALRGEWTAKLASHRAARGRRQRPRAGSATARLVELLPEAPILTTRTVQRLLGLSFPTARSGLEELADAGVLTRRTVERGTTGYSALDIFNLIGHTERRLASTRWDTRLSPPNRAVPARPAG